VPFHDGLGPMYGRYVGLRNDLIQVVTIWVRNLAD
jgi:hypothetical protein